MKRGRVEECRGRVEEKCGEEWEGEGERVSLKKKTPQRWWVGWGELGVSLKKEDPTKMVGEKGKRAIIKASQQETPNKPPLNLNL